MTAQKRCLRMSYSLVYGPMITAKDNLYRWQNIEIFDGTAEGPSVFSSPDEALKMWTEWMRRQGYEMMELPRRCGWGVIYSTIPSDGSDSLLYNVELRLYNATEAT